MIVLGLDLKRASSNCNPARHSLARGIDEQRQAGVLACHSACAADDVSPVRRTLWWGAQDQELFLARAISLHGLCPTDYRESVPDIDACLRAQAGTLYHMGIKSRVSRSTLADADEVRDWRLYAEFSQMLIGIARRLHVWELFGIDLKDTAYALDASTIDLCLSVFPWAPFRSTKVAVKLHTLWDLRGNLPTFLHISDENCTMSMSSPVAPRAGCLLCHGPRLSRLRTAPWPARRSQLLCDPRQIQPPSPSSVLASGRPEHGG